MKFIYSIIALLLCCSLYAQSTPMPEALDNYQCIDTSVVELRYSFKFKRHSSLETYNEDLRVVQIGNKVVKDFSQFVYHYDSLATENFKKGVASPTNPKNPFPCEIYSYPQKKERHEKFRLTLNTGALSYPSEWEEIIWTYSEDEPVQWNGYTCNKASTTFAGREYTAWYTFDIPIVYGPYKFYGLPGLIVKLEESTGMYIWEINSLSMKKAPINLYEYNKEQKCSAKSAAATIDRMMKKPITFATSLGARIMIKQPDGSLTPPSGAEEEIPYEPIELR